LKLRSFVRNILDERKTQFVLQIRLPELLVVVDICLEIRIDKFLCSKMTTPAALVSKIASYSLFTLQEAAMLFAFSIPARSSCSISIRSFYSASPVSSSFPNNINNYNHPFNVEPTPCKNYK
jgi:hypothetical protein